MYLKPRTYLAGIYTEIPYSDSVVQRTRHEAIVDWRHTEGNNSTAAVNRNNKQNKFAKREREKNDKT